MKPDAVDYGIVSLKSRYSVTETIDGVKSMVAKAAAQVGRALFNRYSTDRKRAAGNQAVLPFH